MKLTYAQILYIVQMQAEIGKIPLPIEDFLALEQMNQDFVSYVENSSYGERRYKSIIFKYANL